MSRGAGLEKKKAGKTTVADGRENANSGWGHMPEMLTPHAKRYGQPLRLGPKISSNDPPKQQTTP